MDTQHKPAARVIESLMGDDWLITDAGRERMIEIAARENVITAEVISKIGERRDAVAAKKLARMDGADAVSIRDGVAVIDVNGPIFRYADVFQHISGGTSVESLATDFAAALADPNVRGVLFNFDSPGGQVNGINEFANQVFAARGGDKPVVAYVGAMACSAAYWIASACDAIVVDDTGSVGSIGVIVGMRKPSSSGIDVTSRRASRKVLNPETESGKAALQARADSIENVFVAAIARNRAMSEEAVTAEEGAVVMGAEALKAGLADRIGSFEGVLSEISKGTYSTSRQPSSGARAHKLTSVMFGADGRIHGYTSKG